MRFLPSSPVSLLHLSNPSPSFSIPCLTLLPLAGLYSDPTATPFQRLSLSAHNETTGAFSLGTFSMR